MRIVVVVVVVVCVCVCVCDMLHVAEKQNVFEYNNDCI